MRSFCRITQSGALLEEALVVGWGGGGVGGWGGGDGGELIQQRPAVFGSAAMTTWGSRSGQKLSHAIEAMR